MMETEWGNEMEYAPDPVYTECSAEYTLPDYLPDVRRILTVRGQLLPGGVYLNNGKAEVGGSCIFHLLYIAPDGDVAGVGVTGEYKYTVNVGEEQEGDVSFYQHSHLEQVSCRLIGPRKMLCRGMVVSKPKWWKEDGDDVVLEEQEDLCFLEKECVSKRTFPFLTQDKSMKVSLPLEGAGDAAVLSSNATVLVREIGQGNQGKVAKGDVYVEAVLAGEDGIPFTLSGKSPFEESLPEGIEENIFCTGEVTSLEVGVAEEGERPEVVFDMTFRLAGHSTENRPLSLVTDVFSGKYPTEVAYGEKTICRHVANVARCFNIDGSVDRPTEMMDGTMTVSGTFLTLDSPTFSVDDHRLTAEIPAHVTMLLCSEENEESPSLYSHHFDYPLKMEIPLSEMPPENTKWEVLVTATPAHGRLDQNKLFFEGEVSLFLSGTSKETYQVAEKMEEDKDHPYKKDAHRIIAAYLESGDSLWSIAKRYHTSPERIAKQNNLAEVALEHPDQTYTLDGYIRLLITT